MPCEIDGCLEVWVRDAVPSVRSKHRLVPRQELEEKSWFCVCSAQNERVCVSTLLSIRNNKHSKLRTKTTRYCRKNQPVPDSLLNSKNVRTPFSINVSYLSQNPMNAHNPCYFALLFPTAIELLVFVDLFADSFGFGLRECVIQKKGTTPTEHIRHSTLKT